MQTACDDVIQKKIVDEIDNRRLALKDRFHEMKKVSTENVLFKAVLGDYNKYYKHMLTEKEKQRAAFQAILDHLDKLSSETSISEHKMKEMKSDQIGLLHKIGFVRKEIDDIMGVVKDMDPSEYLETLETPELPGL